MVYQCGKCKKTIIKPRTWLNENKMVKYPVCEKCFNKILEEKKNG